MKRILAGIAIATVSFVATVRAQLTLSGVTMYGATNSSGNWNGSYDYWDTVGGNFGFNVYLFTGSTNSPVFLNSGDTDASLNPNIVLSPGVYVIQFACDFHGWDPDTTYLGMNLYFNNNSATNQISAVVLNAGSCIFAVVNSTTTTYGEGAATPGSGSLSYTSGNLTATLSDFCTSPNTPNLVSGYTNAPGSESDFIGSFTLTVTPPPQPTLNIQKAVYLTAANLLVGSNYQVQASMDLSNWTNQGLAFTATNSNWQSTNYWSVSDWNQLFFRLQSIP